MALVKRVALFINLLFAFSIIQAQSDSCQLRISLLTCGPGQDLYSIWGHTGIRVIDSSSLSDVVFNYGTFDDSDPLFYIKFTRGIMLYSVTPFSFTDFMEEYRYDKRSVTEQVLRLSCREKLALAKALWTNSKPENKFYPYHFYADNCTTRAREMLLQYTDSVQFRDIRPQPTSTYRQLIHSYMNNSSQAWNRFAIDVLLGNHLDETMTNRQAMFLPDYLMKGLDSAATDNLPLVSERILLLPDGQADQRSFFTPAFVFAILLLLMIVFSLMHSRRSVQVVNLLDRLFFLCTGLLGCLMLALWIFRVDSVCRNNYNLLWALPTHAFIAFFIQRKTNWVKNYWLFTAVLTLLLLLAWYWLPQEMNKSILLILIIVLFRSIYRYQQISLYERQQHRLSK